MMNIAPPRLPSLEAQGWELRWQLTAIEPLETPSDLTGVALTPPPRSNIVVSRTLSSGVSAGEFAENTKQQLEASGLGFKQLGLEDVEFGDGAKGVKWEISFLATPEVTLCQQHLFRVDGEVITQLVATYDERVKDDVSEALRAEMLKFKPDAEP